MGRSMRVITFYSYKGGVGRSLTAANFAVYLAQLGFKTIIIDFDLEAPGIDAKFGLPKLTEDQKGLLDYILAFQETNEDPNNLEEIMIPIPLEDKEGEKTCLSLIPAGQYLSPRYHKKLNQLDWGLIFSTQRDGIPFFQQFLAHLQEDFAAEFVIIDSRTGITEIAGLCTQILADEVVVLSSLSSESIRVTKHIKELIKNSQMAKALEKEIAVKIVVSRVPKPDDLLEFKEECCQTFEAEEDKLFFLFSCPALERKEFLAILDKDKDEELMSNYVKLFYALNIDLADTNILAEIENVSRRILMVSPEEAEKSIRQLAALYPHPEAYRVAMHFFGLKGQENDLKIFAWKLFDILPEDEEVQTILSQSYLQSAERTLTQDNLDISLYLKNAIKAINPVYLKKKLNYEEQKIYAKILQKAEEYEQSFEIADLLCSDEKVDFFTRYEANQIALYSANILGYADEFQALIEQSKELEEELQRRELDDIPF